MVSIEEYPFIFMNTPASLQVLASAEMALTIWRREFANTSYPDARERLYSEETPRCKKVLDVLVPRRIQSKIDQKIVSIGKELKEWMDFHLNQDLLNSCTEAFFNCSKHIVADFSGSIGYKATAINILNSGEFNDEAVNYKISCLYCLEDQVKRFWPAVANDPPTDTNSRYDKCNNLSYWNGLMEVRNSITDAELVKLQMMGAEAQAQTNSVQIRIGYVTAFEYFCNMLPDDVRMRKIISWVNGSYCGQAVAGTLSTLDRVQAEKVFEKQACSIFKILMKNEDYFQFLHQLWTLMGHLVLEDESKFSDIVFELWKMPFEHTDCDCDGPNCTRWDQTNDLLFEIWSTASDESKAHVSTPFLFKYRMEWWDDFASYYGHDMSFMLEMMSKSTDVDKKLLWQKNWQALAIWSKPLYLEQFMRMCLSNNEEIELFKNELVDFEHLFESLIEEGFYQDLKDYLMLCSKDAEQFHVLGKKVLGSNFRFILIHDDDKFAKFDWFVGEVFANVQKDMDEFKSQMISSAAECLKHLLAARKADKISSNDFSRIIGRFVNNEDELQLVKHKLFEHCREYPTETCFNADEWQEFLAWCNADPDEISAFKRSLNVDVIFLDRLRRYLKHERSFGGLVFLDNFLNWYFGNEKDAKNFKLDKIKNYKQSDILRVKMETRFIYSDGLMYDLLLWFFDDNVENVREFCESCNCPLP